MHNKCRVYLEHYTSILTCGKEELEKFYQRNDNIRYGINIDDEMLFLIVISRIVL